MSNDFTMKFKCDPLVKLTCLTTNTTTNNDCTCTKMNTESDNSILNISYSSEKQKNDICNDLHKFGILSFVDFDNICNQRNHNDTHNKT